VILRRLRLVYRSRELLRNFYESAPHKKDTSSPRLSSVDELKSAAKLTTKKIDGEDTGDVDRLCLSCGLPVYRSPGMASPEKKLNLKCIFFTIPSEYTCAVGALELSNPKIVSSSTPMGSFSDVKTVLDAMRSFESAFEPTEAESGHSK